MPEDIEPTPVDRLSAHPPRSAGQRYGKSGRAATLGGKRRSGFSLIELMVTVVVFAILLLVGVPSMQTLLMNNRMTSRMNALSASLQLVRAEAVKRNATAAIVPGQGCSGSGSATSGTGASPQASGGGCANTDWAEGWSAYVERDGADGPDIGSDANDTSCVDIDNEGIDSYTADGETPASSRDCLLWQEEAQTELTVESRANTATATSGSDIMRVEFGGAGSPVCRTSETNGENACYFVFCDTRGDASAHALLLSASGHVRVSQRDPQNRPLVCPVTGD